MGGGAAQAAGKVRVQGLPGSWLPVQDQAAAAAIVLLVLPVAVAAERERVRESE